jgi:hypothetical protein
MSKTRTGKYRKGDPCFAVEFSDCHSFGKGGHLCMLKRNHKGKHKCTGCGYEYEWKQERNQG